MTATNPSFRKAAVAFLDELNRLVVDLSPDRQDWTQAADLAHQIQGAAEFFGAHGTGAAARALEVAVKTAAAPSVLTVLMYTMVEKMQADAASLQLLLYGPATGECRPGGPAPDRRSAAPPTR